jgi:hypothetical protein
MPNFVGPTVTHKGVDLLDVTEHAALNLAPTGDDLASSAVDAAALMLFDGSAYDRGRSLDAGKTAAASPDVGIAAVNLADRRYTAKTLATAAASVQSWDVAGANAVLVHLATTRTGTITFEVSADPAGTQWASAEVRDVGTDLWVSGTSFSPTADKVYRIVTNGWRQLRIRTVTTLSGTVDVTATLASLSPIVNAIDTGPAPHAIGYTQANKVAQYTTTQTGVALWTPATGRRIVVTSAQIQVGGTTPGTVQVWFGASADTTYTRGTDKALFDGEFAPSSTSKPGVMMGNGGGALAIGAVDEILRVTDSAAINPLTVNVWGYETL